MFANLIKLLLLGMLFASPAYGKVNTKNSPAVLSRHATLVMNADDGTILHQENAYKSRHPASLTKMMTIYLAFEALQTGRLQQNNVLTASAHAASRPRTNLNLKKGARITTKEAILATIVKSANDAAVILAESIAGSEEAFARMMNAKAVALGMHGTKFYNASGWHHPKQVTTAYDMAKLARALKTDFPQYYHLFSRTSFVYKNTTYHGHNRVLASYPGATGLKTGFVNASGFNLVTSAHRSNTNLIGVVMGGHSAVARDKQMVTLLDKHFGGASNLHRLQMVKQTVSKKIAKKPAVKKSRKKKV